MIKCQACGSKQSDNSQFCDECGTRLNRQTETVGRANSNLRIAVFSTGKRNFGRYSGDCRRKSNEENSLANVEKSEIKMFTPVY